MKGDSDKETVVTLA